MAFKPLPPDEDVYLARNEVQEYGFPAVSTLARWASDPTKAPMDLPYVVLGNRALYRVGDLRLLREKLTNRHATERWARSSHRTVTLR